MTPHIDGTTPILADETMRALGFTDHVPERWYIVKGLDRDVTLNITIDKATGNYEEFVIDEFFGQPAYYGNMVEPYRTDIRNAVDLEIGALNAAGLSVAVDHGLYGRWAS